MLLNIYILDPKNRDLRSFIAEAITVWILWRKGYEIYRVGANFLIFGAGLPEIRELNFDMLYSLDEGKAHLITDVARGRYNPKPDFLILSTRLDDNLKMKVEEIGFIEVKSRIKRKSVKYNEKLAQKCREVGIKFVSAIAEFKDNWKLDIEFKEV